MVLAWENGDGLPGGDGLARALERDAHGAGVDQEGFALVFVPVVERVVNCEAGFDVGFHSVLGGGVVGEEVECALAVFGHEWVVGSGAGFGDRVGEEGKHGCCVQVYERLLGMGCGRRIGFGGTSIRWSLWIARGNANGM